MTTVIVGCSKSKKKIDEPLPAEERYTGTYFGKSMKVSEQYDGETFILSAKFGLISPQKKIPNYNVSMYDHTSEDKKKMADKIDTSNFDDDVVVFAGKPYVQVIKDAVNNSTNVKKPLSGGLGEQMSQLNDMMENGTE